MIPFPQSSATDTKAIREINRAKRLAWPETTRRKVQSAEDAIAERLEFFAVLVDAKRPPDVKLTAREMVRAVIAIVGSEQ